MLIQLLFQCIFCNIGKNQLFQQEDRASDEHRQDQHIEISAEIKSLNKMSTDQHMFNQLNVFRKVGNRSGVSSRILRT